MIERPVFQHPHHEPFNSLKLRCCIRINCHDTIGRISTMPEEGKRKEFTNPTAKREPAMKSNAAMGTSGKLSLLLVLRPPAVHIGRPAFRGWRQRCPSSEATAVLG